MVHFWKSRRTNVLDCTAWQRQKHKSLTLLHAVCLLVSNVLSTAPRNLERRTWMEDTPISPDQVNGPGEMVVAISLPPVTNTAGH